MALIDVIQLTPNGREIASNLYAKECHTRPCSACPHRNTKTNGPGGEGCPAVGLETRSDVNVIYILSEGEPTPFNS